MKNRKQIGKQLLNKDSLSRIRMVQHRPQEADDGILSGRGREVVLNNHRIRDRTDQTGDDPGAPDEVRCTGCGYLGDAFYSDGIRDIRIIGISRQHVSKELRLQEGLRQVSHGRSNVGGNRCKMNAYVLEPSEMERAKDVFMRNPDALSGNIFPDETVNKRKARFEINEALRILDDGGPSDHVTANKAIRRLSSTINFLLKEVA